jgi:hypothetical protein
MRKFTGPRPVRFERGRGWIECLPHMAQRWQAILTDRQLMPPPYARSKRHAMQMIEANLLRHAPQPRNYKLGKQMEKRNA